jgi:DNA ligase-1
MTLEFMLAKEYSEGMKMPRGFTTYAPLQWYMSEKLDGYRARFNPETNGFISRQNKPYTTPTWFLESMPKIHLDGELFCGRDNFQKMGVVRKKKPKAEEWHPVKFYVYDAPEYPGTFQERYDYMVTVVDKAKQHWKLYQQSHPELSEVSCPIVLTEHTEITTIEQMKQFYQNVLKLGGEGIMLKDPKSSYENKRSNYLLKYKPCFDAEAIITGYKPGTGKYTGKLGAFLCKPLTNQGTHQIIDENPDHEFAISGMDDEVRDSYLETHKVGTIITYEYSGFTGSGKPRFARYIRIRTDVTLQTDNKQSNDKLKLCIEQLTAIQKYEQTQGNAFKAKAYKRAVECLHTLTGDHQLVTGTLMEMKGIGKSMIETIEEIMKDGISHKYKVIADKPNPLKDFQTIYGVGPKKAKQLMEIGFKSLQELKECDTIDQHLNSKQLIGLKHVDDLQKRIPFSIIKKHESYLNEQLHHIDETAQLTIAGSYRRKKSTSGDIDVLLTTSQMKPSQLLKQFVQRLIQSKYLTETLSLGTKKFMGICQGVGDFSKRIDIMVTKPEEYPFAILYFTGSKDFNTKMRADMLTRGLTLNEYALKNSDTKEPVNHVFKTELDIFHYIKYDYVEPEDR